MKDLNEIKYKTNRFDEEGNPIYITEAEFREHGIYTISPEEQVTPKEEEKKKLSIEAILNGILTGLKLLFFSLLPLAGCGVLFAIGIATASSNIGEAIGICIISGVIILTILSFIIYFTITLCKGSVKYGPDLSSSSSDSPYNDGISGEYITFGHTRNDGSTVTYIYKKH